ncbi:MAG: c-type cytochrome [Verrucomicrobia bacterium]|nr:c-type cytochrome [Verrucomicrobiota bacterium]
MKFRRCSFFAALAALTSFALIAAGQKSETNAPAKPASKTPKSSVSYSEAYGKKGEQPKLDPAKDLPRFPALSPAEALKSFKVKKGFRVDLAASEPNVLSPIAIAFDENNRMFVVEMLDYSELRDAKPHLGRIRMLESTRGDGVFDKATVFADDLPWPTGVICYNGGLFVIASPDIVWLKDTKGTGKADERKVVFTGFGSGVSRLNVQALPNCLQWSLDNRIHGATAGNGGVIKQVAASTPQPDLNLSGRDFSFDPRTLTMRAEGPTAQYGMSFDSKGRKFVCSNSDHLQVLMYDARYAGRNPFYAMPSARVSIAEDGPAAEVFRISPDEPWRIIRTRWRISGVVPGMVEGGGRVSGYFTGATGATIYRGNAFGPDFADNAFIGDAGGNLVHRKKIYPAPDGVGLVARRPDDEKNFEFLASTDTWFRPVLFANAPDGCLYVCDMYREVIEHPWSIPESIKQHIDLNSGNDRGRIWRIAPENFKQPKPVQLGKATAAELVKLLEHPNGWHRDTAARLLYEQQDTAAVAMLEKLQEESKSALGRMHALYALDGLGANSKDTLLLGRADGSEIVRGHAIDFSAIALSKMEASLDKELMIESLVSRSLDESKMVRYHLAFALTEIKHKDKGSALEEIARQAPRDKWTRAAVICAMADKPAELLWSVGVLAGLEPDDWRPDYAKPIMDMIGARNKQEEIKEAIRYLNTPAKNTNKPIYNFALTRALGDGLQRAGSSLAKADPEGKLKPQFAQAARLAADAQTPEATRAEAVQLLGLTSYAESGATLLALLEGAQPQPVQLAALGTLARFTEPTLGDELTKRWNNFSARLKSEALTVLLARPERAGALLAAIEGGAIRPTELGSTQIKQLLNHRDVSIRAQATKLLGNSIASRDSVVKNFMPALQLRGDAAKGKALYTERCVSCHRAGAEGFALGPDLVTVKNTGAEKLLVNILDPNREVAPQYIAFTVETKDDESLVGLIANETTTHVTIRMAFGMEKTLPRTAIRGMKSSGQSLMPEGLEQNLTPQGLADLIEFIMTLK